MTTVYDLKRIAYSQGDPVVTVLEDGSDPEYLERRAISLAIAETNPRIEYRVIARY